MNWGGGGVHCTFFAIFAKFHGRGGGRWGLKPGCMDFSPLNSESLDLPSYI